MALNGGDTYQYFLGVDNGGVVTTWNAATGAGTYCPGCIGADKVSDGNAQVFALAPLERVKGIEPSS